MPLGRDPRELLDAARARDRRALARLLTMVERGGDDARSVARAAHSSSADPAYTVGITGAPGAGKSTLTTALVDELRDDETPVAVLAIDPSSPFTGGAILGDRVRMQQHATDPQVFIRSMATRGHLGGLSLATPAAVRLLGAAGWPWVVIETVGVGQIEVDIAGAADTTVVVVNPGWGDSVQANKAGLLEIADVFVVNKAERPGAEDAVRDLDQMLELGGAREWRPPIVCTTAVDGIGVPDLAAAIDDHRSFLDEGGRLEQVRRRRGREELTEIVRARLEARLSETLDSEDGRAVLERLAGGELDPHDAADALLGDLW